MIGHDAFSQNGSWNINANGNWSANVSWTPVAVPGGANSIVNFTRDISGNRVATIDATSRTVGVLNVGDTNASHSYTLAANGGASLIFDNSGTSQLNFVSAGSPNVISAPISLLDSLTISNASNGNQTISGTVSAGSSGGKIITNAGAGAGGVTLSGIISNNVGNASVIQNSATSVLTITGSNTYSGNTTLSSGKLRIGNNSAFGTGALLLNGGTLSTDILSPASARTITNNTTLGADVVLGDAADLGRIAFGGTTTLTGNRTITLASAVQFSGQITGAFNLTKLGAGDVTFSSTNSDYNGGFTLDGGRAIAANSTGNTFGTGAVTLTSGTLTSSDTTARSFANAVNFGGNVTLGDATSNGTLTFLSTGTLTGNRTLTINSAVQINGAIGQTGGNRSLTKSGVGTLTLGGNNTYTGSTIVSAGTLLLNGAAASIGSSPTIRVASGATLNTSGVTGGFQLRSGQRLENGGTFTGSLTALAGSTYAPGNSPGIATQNGNLTLSTSSAFEWELIANTTAGAGTNFDQTAFASGGLTIQTGVAANLIFNAGSTVNWSNAFWSSNQQWLVFSSASSLSAVPGIFTAVNLSLDSIGASLSSVRSGASFNFTSTGNDVFLNYTAIPEPSTWALLAVGAGALALLKRKRARIA